MLHVTDKKGSYILATNCTRYAAFCIGLCDIITYEKYFNKKEICIRRISMGVVSIISLPYGIRFYTFFLSILPDSLSSIIGRCTLY